LAFYVAFFLALYYRNGEEHWWNHTWNA
jgi:hypothetical protein